MKQPFASWYSRVLVFITLIGSCCKVQAQYNTVGLYSQTYKATDGLPDSYTLALFQDSRQYLWIGTYSGLSRFDGKNFTNYGMSNGIPDLYVNAIQEDKQNRLWIGTRKGIGYLQNNRYVPTSSTDKENIDYVFNFGLFQKDKLWAFTSKGLYEFADSVWTKKIFVKGFENVACRSAVEKDDALYLCYPNNLVKVLPDGSSTIIASASPTNSPAYLQLQQFNNRLFVNTISGLNEIKNDQLFPIYTEQTAGKTIYCFFMDSRQRMWVSTEEEGLLVSAPGDEKKLTYKVPSGYHLISDFYEDKENNIWVAGFEGLAKVKTSFYNILSPDTQSRDIEYHNIITDSKGDTYVYGHKGGLYYTDGNSMDRMKFARHFNLFEKEIMSERADVLCTDNRDNFWVVTRRRELKKITASGMQENVHPEGNNDHPDLYYYVMNDPPKDRLYFCGQKLYILEHDTIKEFRSARTNEPITDPGRTLLLANGNILVSSRTSGLWLIKPGDKVFKITSGSGLPFDSRILLAEDKHGKLWVATAGMGLQLYRWNTDTTLYKEADITTHNGLPNDVAEAVTVDGSNRLWAGTLSGLVVIDTLPAGNEKNYIVYNIGKEQGLDFTLSNSRSKLITDRKGDVWFCSYNKVIRFRTKELVVYTNPPITHIEQVTLNMKETDWHQWSDSLTGYFMLPRHLRLPYNENTLTFTFNAINYETNEDIWYSYRLMGVDTAWSSPVKSNMLSLVKLSPGNFTFLVRARKTNSAWSTPAEFSFYINTPFWNTWWFRIIGILVASLILVAIFRSQYKKIHKKLGLQNQLRQLEMKALKAQMNPHFVYNALNSIQSLVIDNKQEALDYMVKFSRLLRQVLNHSEQNVVTLEKELATLKLYIELESLRLQYALDYSFTIDENILPENESIPPLILQPFVENALWHGLSDKEGEKRLAINIYSNDEWLFCEISDNGVGRLHAEKKNRPSSYREGPRGMEITINRLNLYNGQPIPDSIIIKDLVHPDGTALGTTFTIKILRK